MQYYWRDEREWNWTRVIFDSSGILIRLGRNHYAGGFVGGAMFAAIFAMMMAIPIGNNHWFLLFFAVGLPICVYLNLKRISRIYDKFPIHLYRKKPVYQGGMSIPYSDILALVVRENSGRQHVDDIALVQLYALVSTLEFPLLINQHYVRYRDKVIQVARKMADEIGVELRIDIKEVE